MVIKTAFLFQLLAFLVKKVQNEQEVMMKERAIVLWGTFGDDKEIFLRLATRVLMHFWNTICPEITQSSLTFCHDQPLNLFGQSQPHLPFL